MELRIKVNAKVQGRATSGYTREQVESRLRALEGAAGDEAAREREYLRALLQRKGWVTTG